MKYDDASWHYGRNFPADLPKKAGATHIAMFVAWAVLSGLAGEFHTVEMAAPLSSLRARRVSPREWFTSACDGKFTNEDLSEEGNRFARAYYADETGLRDGPNAYITDYTKAFPSVEYIYYVPDTWATFKTLQSVIQSRFAFHCAAR